MKTIKLAFLITIALMAFGCNESKPYTTVRFGGELVKCNYDIISIDGCEYIQIGAGNTMSIAHRGNCKNPIHIYNIEKGTQLENKEISNDPNPIISANDAINIPISTNHPTIRQ